MKISTFVACRDHGKYVWEAICSVQTQTVVPAQVILINDGSKDETNEVFWSAQQSWNNVEVYTHLSPHGHIASYNHGISISTGDVIHLMSADDLLIDPYFYEEGLDYLSHGCTLVTGGLRWINEVGQTLWETQNLNREKVVYTAKEALERMLREGNYICGAATLVTADVQRRHLYDETFPYTADAVNWARILGEGHRLAYLRRCVFSYRRHSGAMTHISAGTQEERRRMGKEIERAYDRVCAMQTASGDALSPGHEEGKS